MRARRWWGCWIGVLLLVLAWDLAFGPLWAVLLTACFSLPVSVLAYSLSSKRP